MKILDHGTRWLIGTGESINVWQHHWLLEKPSCNPHPSSHNFNVDLKVNQLWLEGRKQWDENKVRSVVVQEHVDKVLRVHYLNQ